MKTLLMATDLSARSDRALERALRIAGEHDASLTILHVVDEDLPATLADAQGEAAQRAIRDHIESATAADRPQVTIEVAYGRAHAEILEMSETIDADLIILGVHREDAFKDMFRGTTAERVIRAGNVPVLLVKERSDDPYRRIMVGVDFSVYSRRAVEFAIRFAPAGTFNLVHAFDVPFKGFLNNADTKREVSKQHESKFQEMVEAEMATFLSTLEARTPALKRIMKEGTVHEVIHGQVQSLRPDLLVVGTHGRTGVAHALLGSIAENMLRAPPCDVLAVNAW